MGRRTSTLLPTSARLLKPKPVPKPVEELVAKKREKQAHYYNRGAKRLKELKQGDIVRMKPDPKNPKMLWKKATCLKEVAPGSYEVVLEERRYRRKSKDLIAIQESPGVDSDVEEPDKPPLSDDQSQGVVEPVQPGTPLLEDTNPGRPETPQRPPESPQPTERRSTRGRVIKTPIRFKDYRQP